MCQKKGRSEQSGPAAVSRTFHAGGTGATHLNPRNGQERARLCLEDQAVLGLCPEQDAVPGSRRAVGPAWDMGSRRPAAVWHLLECHRAEPMQNWTRRIDMNKRRFIGSSPERLSRGRRQHLWRTVAVDQESSSGRPIKRG